MNSISIDVIDEQNDFIIVNKPHNVGFHDEDGQTGFFNCVKETLNLEQLLPVHRLDKMTSGLIIFAKNKQAAQLFQQLFESKKIQKYYVAISDKKPRKKQGMIKGDMEKSRRGAWKLLRTNNNPAISYFHSFSLGDSKRLFIVKPQTGKTHQIRVALSSLGSPIIGDPTYYNQSKSDRGYLHAYALSFEFSEQQYQYILPPTAGIEFENSSIKSELEDNSPPWDLTWPKGS